ncbi:MAG: 1-acyl-sn-glycerol-3-phosphate acyltransferase [Moraxellaceae bacterium]|nr:1-acyl-sn-glycerol-3-phosphate acyltransferase [Moraxellaceae bacterium]
MTGDFPNEPKAVLIVAPHTSNYDGRVVVSALLALGMRVSFFVKHTAFRWPVAGLMRWFGALPVNRESSQDLVGFSASKFSEKNELLLAMAPEGTRDSSPAFKSGFYWIARQAGVPVIVIGFDYGRREVRILKTLAPSGDPERDLPDILACYRGITPRHPERLSLPLRELDRTAPD